MNKEAFLYVLRGQLRSLAEDELQERLSFYDEMIEDLMSEGMCEEEAVAKMGSAEAIAQQILDEKDEKGFDRETLKNSRKSFINDVLSKVGLQNSSSCITNTYTIDALFRDILVHTDEADIIFELSKDETVQVIYEGKENRHHDVSVIDNELRIIDESSTTLFALNIGRRPRISIYLPQEVYGRLHIESDCGSITLNPGLTFEKLNVYSDCGKFTCCSDVKGSAEVECDCAAMNIFDMSCGSMRLSNDAGAIELCNIKCHNDIRIEDDAGAIRLNRVTCRNLKCENDAGKIDLHSVAAQGSLNLSSEVGSIQFVDCSCANAEIESDVGSVKGNFLSEMTYIAKSDIGSVFIPQGTTGGICRVNTKVGSIHIN